MSNEEKQAEQTAKDAVNAIEFIIEGFLFKMVAEGYCDEHIAIRVEAILATVCDTLHERHAQPLLVLRDMLDEIIEGPNDPNPDLH